MWQKFYSGFQRCFIASIMLAASIAKADETVTIPFTEKAPKLEDYLSGIPDNAGVKVSGFRQYAPGDGEPSGLETEVFLSYDKENLYAVFVCKDDPEKVRARISRREDLIGDDAVQLYVDSFNDKQRAYRFLVNPYGVQMDARQTEGLGPDFDYDTQWQSDGQITDDGYLVSISIPFTSLRFPNTASQEWGIAVGRIIPRLNEFSHWPYITQREQSFIPQFATAKIEDEISPGRNIQLIPYAFFSDTRALNGSDPQSPTWDEEQHQEVGLDAKFVIADSYAVDVTLNPDFSEVEADAPQVIIDKRFEVLFPEKRPFFLENSAVFGTPQPLFFSRRILDPEYGARVTGKTGSWSVGALAINDEAGSLFLSPDDPDAGKNANIAVGRLQKDFDTDSNLGVLITQRDLGGRSNRVASIDSRYKINNNWVMTGQLADSRTSQGNIDDSNGDLAFFEVKRGGRNFNYTGQYLDISEDFDSSLGFIPRTNIKQISQTASYLWHYPDADWLLNMGPTVSWTGIWDQEGEMQERSTDAYFSVNGLKTTTFEGHLLEGYERYQGFGFDKSGYLLAATSEWYSWLTATVTAGEYNVINYWPTPGVNAFVGDSKNASLSLKITPHSQLRIEETFFWNELSTQDAIGSQEQGTRVYKDIVSRTKFSYQYDRFLSMHLIFDYHSLDTNTHLIAFGKNKNLNTDVLFRYVLNPGTALYFGYTNRQENIDRVGNPAVLQRTDDLAMHTGEQFFIKFSYLFQY